MSYFLRRFLGAGLFLAFAYPVWMLTGIDPQHLGVLIIGGIGIAAAVYMWVMFADQF